MRSMVLGAMTGLVLACGGKRPPAPAIGPADRIPCGTASCPSDQYCVITSTADAAAPSPGVPTATGGGATSAGCSPTIPDLGAAGRCGKPRDRRVYCQVAAP